MEGQTGKSDMHVKCAPLVLLPLQMVHAKDGDTKCWLTFPIGIVGLEAVMELAPDSNSFYHLTVDLECNNPSLTILEVRIARFLV